uniref:Uncharacterized protein n=1 Tax=Amphimedon queenslandica TaxID=400682 RepID=A0A1X7T7F7_AMPQE
MEEATGEEIILEEIQDLTEDQFERALEIAKEEEEGINSDLHFLLLGRPGVGKSTFAGELTGGKIKGSSGPTGGTKSSNKPGQWRHIKTEKMEEANSTKLDGSNTKKVYFVHDTVGLGHATLDLDEMKHEAKEVCEQSGHCSVFLCLGWEDRMDDINTERAFDVCHSLNVWENVVVVITKCDSNSQDSDPNSEESLRIKEQKLLWKQSIKDKLESINVEGSEIAKITEKIIFYPNKKIAVGRFTWLRTLMQRLKDIIIRSGANLGLSLSGGISIVLSFVGQNIAESNDLASLSCIQSSDSHQVRVQEVAGPNQNIDDTRVSSKNSQKLKKIIMFFQEKSKAIAATIYGGSLVGGGAIGGGAIGGLIGAFAIGGGAAAITGGVAIGVATGGIGVAAVIIIALIAYFCLKD